ncbi:related to alcohol oxidase [Rhynchosporium agropyri]|uniref:Related to alcohol oxidase n=1 Tax=Rhynchosporium agropyri TaxID=914238 RepID=A0A1E1KEI3_9HELO|nr:related to alcohol oxidase [Rhynchosporium agropyri]
MPISNTLPDGLEEFDIIVAGGGTAGCIVASRLAAADPDLLILVVEYGQNNYQLPEIVHPALFPVNVMPGSTAAIFWQTEESEALAGRKLVVPSGGILGGGSSLETYHGPGSSKTHGSDGPMHVSSGGFRSQGPEEDFITAAAKVGFPEITDSQDLESTNGMCRWLRYVSPEGTRQDTAHAYLHPLLVDGKHPNLHVLVETQITRVLFHDDGEEKRASGVEICANPMFPSSSMGLRFLKARRLVVVSAGTFGSPLILERSGIGSSEILERAGVTVIADVPGVGHDYQDHNEILCAYKTSLGIEETQNALLGGLQTLADAAEKGDPRVGWNTVDVAGKIRPSLSEVAALGPDFEVAWEKDFKHEPAKPLGLIALIAGYLGDRSLVQGGEFIQVVSYSAYPYSRGSIHITGPEITDKPRFVNGYLTDANDFDLKAHVWQYKKQREIMRRTRMYRGEVAAHHPVFPLGSKAACLSLDILQSTDTTTIEDVVYTVEDDKAIEDFVRENLTTTWHALGTAKMAPREDMGVVDRSLNVYGVRGLKVVDLSIVPENVGANTNNTAMMIGEKGAVIIAEELGLGRV